MVNLRPFHAAYPVPDIDHVRPYYGDILGCGFGRSDETWIDINFFGHQLVFHKVPGFEVNLSYNPVDAKKVPIPHFGVVLTPEDWKDLSARLIKCGTEFIIAPYLRFEGQAGEQGTMFFLDPVGYALEFKCFREESGLFET